MKSPLKSSTRTPSCCAPSTCTGWKIPGTVKAVGRVGAGTNNIPVAEYSKRGIPVFNAPSANALKELAIAGLLLATPHLPAALNFTRSL